MGEGRPGPAVITGIGLTSALGRSAAETWQSLTAGRSGIERLPMPATEGTSMPRVARVPAPERLRDPGRGVQTRIAGLHTWLLVRACTEAWNQADLPGAGLSARRIGLFAGLSPVECRPEDLLGAAKASLGSCGQIDYERFFREGYRQIHPLWLLFMLSNIALCQAAARLGIQGDNAVFSPHSDAGARALWEGMQSVAEGRSDAALAGGASAELWPTALVRARYAGLSPRSVLGEAGAFMMFESGTGAYRRGVPALARITGFAQACETEDGPPAVATIQRVMEEALERTGCGPAEVDLVIGHLDGSAEEDRREQAAVKQLLGGAPVWGSKTALGHTQAASVVVDAVLSVLMLTGGLMPVSEAGTPSAVFRRAAVRRILINGRSPQGQVVTLVMERGA